MSEPKIFPDDLVVGRARNGKFKFAIVEHVAGIEDSDEDSSDSEFADFKANPLEQGYVRVTWYPDGKNEEVEESQLQLVDRSCLARDVVRMQDGDQLGTAILTKVMCDVGILGTTKVLKGIDVENLKSILPFCSEDQVVHGPWLGSVRYTREVLLLRFSNGARAKIDSEKQACELLMDLFPHPSDEGGFSVDLFYPGQYLWGPAKAFSEVQWVTGQQIKFKPKMKYRVLIEQIELHALRMKWVSRAFADKKQDNVSVKEEAAVKEEVVKQENAEDVGTSVDPEPVVLQDIKDVKNEAEPPPSNLSKEDLKKIRRLDHFWHDHVCLGERLRYKLTEEDAEKLNKQKSKSIKKTKRMRLAKRMDQKLLHGSSHLSTSQTKRCPGSLRDRRQQATQHDSSGSSSENDDSAYDEEDLEAVDADTGALPPSSGACASVVKDAADDIEVTVNSECDMNIPSPTGVKPTVLGTLSCRVSGFELDFCLIQETVGVLVKRKFQCNIQNPECPKIMMEDISNRFLGFMKTMLKKNKHLIDSTSCAAMMSQCPHAIRTFIMQQSSLSNQEILFEYKTGQQRTSGMIDKDGKKTEVEYLDEEIDLELAPENPLEPAEEGGSAVDPVIDFVLTSGPPAKRQAGPNVKYHAGQWLTVEVARTYTTADVQWQDGSTVNDIPTSKLFPAHHVDDNDFCPGDFVIDKRVPEERGNHGVVLKADSKNRMAKIQWIKQGKPADIEEVSVYEVADHQQLRFRISDVIIRVGNTYTEAPAEDIDIMKRGIGELVKVTDLGMLEVFWTDGSTSLVHPLDVIAVSEENESLFDSSEGIDDFSNSEASWVTASTEDESPDALESDPSLAGDVGESNPLKNEIDAADVNHERGEGSGQPPRIHDEVIHDSHEPQQTHDSTDAHELHEADQCEPVPRDLGGESSETNNMADDEEESQEAQPQDDTVSATISSESTSSTSTVLTQSSDSHLAFSVVSSVPSTHQFIKRWFQETSSKSFMKALQRDLRLLQTSLSTGITVKAYEDRMVGQL